ncbi:MAG: hypothetical protein JNK09_22495 [Prolixibacteraceae bacterium]|nr:hypothetical protein [Prolixibacteraceae bacterium]
MKLKMLFVFLGIVFLCTEAYSTFPKEKYALGKLFFINNDTMSVYVKIDKIINLQNGIAYVDSMGREYHLKPDDARGFCLIYPNDTMFFESITDFQKALFQPKNRKAFFVHRLQTGKISLYYFIDTKLEMDGIDQVSAERGRYFAHFKGEWFPVSNENYWSDFRKILSVIKKDSQPNEWKSVTLKVDSSELKFEDTPEFIHLCNQLVSDN